MNERIKEFAKQAGFKVNFQHEDHQAIRMAQYTEFAELIVKECAEVAGCNGHVSGFSLGDLIKKHFGVEE